MAEQAKTCPVEGCETAIGRDDVMCAACWARVPDEQKAKVARARDRLRRSGNPRWERLNRNDYMLTVNNAIKAAARAPEKAEG